MAEQCEDWLRLGASLECFCKLRKGHLGRHEASTRISTEATVIDVSVTWTLTDVTATPRAEEAN